ncbi:MAG: hypothetical protein A2V83_02460 [Nitrospirae bacterium RBG_16_64_22]|nr:MAG: hypothetical protein A2V83_02460 [Nitrospirae bacterium RBG_16_64_22]
MRILMIAPQPFFQPRGTPFSVLARIRALTDLGHEVDLITYPLGEDVRIPGLRIYRAARIPFLRSIPIGPSWIKFPLDVLVLAASVRRLMGSRYDVVHTHEEAGGIGALLRRLFSFRHVYDMHSSLPEQLRNYGWTRLELAISLMRRFERWVVKRSDVVIAVCPELVKRVNDLSPDKRVLLIENQPVAAECQPSAEDVGRLRESLGLDGKLAAVYTGTFEVNQGLDLLIEGIPWIIGRRPDVVFVLVGGDPDQQARYRSMADRAGVGENVRIVGRRPPEEMPLYLALADILLSPRTTGTNTPLKIYSYLWAGKAIVATDLETHRQVLDETVAVMAAPTREGLARAILDVVENADKRLSLGARAARFAQERYSYAVYRDRVAEAYT